MMLISVVIPAFNEEEYLGQTLASLDRAKAFLPKSENISVQTIVVDNNSLDSTRENCLLPKTSTTEQDYDDKVQSQSRYFYWRTYTSR
jgi:cellulose synthase/poly-beta-1,6-N-acetylglucosamine synthase-like glycosyltransferase